MGVAREFVVTKAQETIALIERNLAGMQSYGHWTVGLTANADLTEVDLDFPAFWRSWRMGNQADAREVKAHFQRKGMKDGGERGRQPTTVFLY